MIEPDMAIVEIWVNKAVSEELLVWRTQISAVSRDDQTEGGEYVEGLSPRGRGNPRLAPAHYRRCWSIPAWAGQPRDPVSSNFKMGESSKSELTHLK